MIPAREAWQEVVVDPALVDRYRTRAPRYTSYPTAPHFHPIPAAAVDAALAQGTGLVSVYGHIPFCKTLCLYCGCHVEIQGKRPLGTAYVDTLLREIELYAARMQPGRQLGQLSLGGGTPTFLFPDDMARLVDAIRAAFPFAPGADVSIEIDPRTVDVPYLHRLVDSGFTRYSFGVQDFDPDVLDTVKRRQTEAEVRLAVDTLRSRGNFDLNLDLMYGLPHQDEASWARTLATVVDLRPSRIALFHYAHVPWMKPAQKVVEKAGLPDSQLKARLFTLAGEKLGEAGYRVVGMDHFALPDDELVLAQAAGTLQRNFMGYTTRAGLDQIGIGVSAIGSFGGVYAQDEKERPAWTTRIEAGELPIARGFVLSADDRRRREVIMELFCNFTVRFAPGEDWAAERARLAPMEADGFVRVSEAGVDVTPLGRHFIRNVCAVFDRYLEADPGARRYSATA